MITVVAFLVTASGWHPESSASTSHEIAEAVLDVTAAVGEHAHDENPEDCCGASQDDGHADPSHCGATCHMMSVTFAAVHPVLIPETFDARRYVATEHTHTRLKRPPKQTL